MLKALTYLQVRLATRDRGATAVEYGLMVAGIAILILVIVRALGGTLNGIFSNINNSING